MAAPEKRIVRRPKNGRRSLTAAASLTAASRMVDDPSQTFKTSMNGTRTAWQKRVWEMFYAVGEFRYYVSWRSNSCSRVRLVASDVDPDTGEPTGSTENKRVKDIVHAIAGGVHGQSLLIKRCVEILSVPGEMWIAIIVQPEGEVWLALTKAEMRPAPEGGTTVTLPSGEKHIINKGSGDVLFRIWWPDPQEASLADSPARSVLDSLEEINRTTKTIRAAARSRLVGNGILLMPTELSLPEAGGPIGMGRPGDPVPDMIGAPAADKVQERLFQIASTAIKDPDSQAATVPLIVTAPGDQLKNIVHLNFTNDITEVALKTRNDAVARLAVGLDVSPERLLGMGSGTNHWSAWAIGDDDVRVHIAPVMDLVVDAINVQVLKRVLERENIDPAKYVLAYDTSPLTVDPDKTDEATDAADRGAVRLDYYREVLGLDAKGGYDLDTLAGCQVWAKDAVTKDPTLLPLLAPLLAAVKGIDFAPPPALPAGPNDPTRADQTNTGNDPQTQDAAPGHDQGNRGRKSDVAKSHAGAVELLVRRALELAGKRRRTRADFDRLRDIPMHQTHRAMGPVGEDEVSDLIKGWDDILDDEFAVANGLDPDVVRAEVRRQAARALTAEVVNA